jgi:glycosyltransferase involved in cell wall biosynthesis
MFATWHLGVGDDGGYRPVKVAFDSRPLSDPNGVGRYSRCLLDALRDTAGGGDEIVETHRPSVTARTASADLFHAPWMDGALLHSRCPTVVTLHDLTPLKRRSELLRTGMRLQLRHLAVQRAASVIVPTEALAEDAVTYLRLERNRIVVIPEAADATMYPRSPQEVAAVRARFELPERYLVWVGGLQHPDPAKHLAKLAATPRELALVLVGPTRPWAHELPNVILTGQVTDGELAAIYSGAHALLLPSEETGFGLSAVEALACGTPVVACDMPSLRELLTGRATLVPRADMAALVRAAQRARRPAPAPPAWTWEDAARATWRVYVRSVGRAATARPAVRVLRGTRAGAGPIDRLRPQ